MECQFIEQQEKRIYSVYHAPETLQHDTIGIILCYPFGQEYIRCHKLYVNLANKLAQCGFHVFRFDYSGTGDSSGDFQSHTIKQSLSDINLVINEVKSLFEISKIILIGVRIGATLSIVYSKSNNINGLVLWNPIYDGKTFLKDLDNEYKIWLSGSYAKEKRRNKPDIINFGFVFSFNLVEELKNLSVNENDLSTNIPIMIIDENKIRFPNNPNIDLEESVNKNFWVKRDNEIDKSIIPMHELDKIIEWVKKNY